MGEQFAGDIHWEGNDISIVRLRTTHVDTVNSKQQVDGLEQTEKLTERWQERRAMVIGRWLVVVGGAVTVISALVLAHPLSVLIVLLALGLVFMDLMGNIVLWDLDLNSISMINLVMAVGLVVDYSMHMAHNFSLQDSSLPRKKRAELAVKETGPKQSTTFLAILPLAFSSSQAFPFFFKMFFGIVVAGGSEGRGTVVG
eukprot:Skav226940  [mRNA]  locus=scaffold965:306282:310879:- [translate_table: standard]